MKFVYDMKLFKVIEYKKLRLNIYYCKSDKLNYWLLTEDVEELIKNINSHIYAQKLFSILDDDEFIKSEILFIEYNRSLDKYETKFGEKTFVSLYGLIMLLMAIKTDESKSCKNDFKKILKELM